MKKTVSRIISVIGLGLFGIVLSSCNLLGSLLSQIDDPSAEQATNAVTRTSEGDGWYTENTVLPAPLAKIGESEYTAYLPASGTVKILVLPIEFSDSPFTSSILSDLKIALDGTPDQTGYWESVSSFYEKSSYGKVKLEYEIADVYKTGRTQQEVYEANVKEKGDSYISDNGAFSVRDAYNAYRNKKNADYIKNNFDTDKNGWIDGVVAVYSGNNYQKGKLSYDKDNYYWAYAYWTVGAETGGALTWTAPNVDDPTPNLYFWLSYDFIYEAVSSPKADAHTLIHETGHMFGLDDYYPDAGGKFNAAGCWSMMDQNILDHDIFSKMLLGWSNPVIANGNGEVSINPSASSGDCILFPSSNWNGTAYDEYILLEYYTPTNLNYLDSHTRYPNRKLGYTIPGIKIYHVDARLVSRNKYGVGFNYKYVEDPKAIPLSSLSSTSTTGYKIAATNCKKDGARADTSFSLLHLMEATGINTFKVGGEGGNDTLFKKGQSFSMKEFGTRFFPKGTTLNKGDTFDYTITVKDIQEGKATISFKKS